VDDAADGQAGLDRFGDGGAYDAVVSIKNAGTRRPGSLRRIGAGRTRAAEVTAFASIDLAVDAMRLGAVDFLRKPMTPETLRGAVAAAIAGQRPRRTLEPGAAPRPPEPLEIAVLTMNGFQILRAPDAIPSSPEHVFRVRHVGDGAEVAVTVTIDAEAVERVARLTHHRLEPGSAFWKLQAERLLSAYVWSEGKPPDSGRLTVRDVAREDLDAAAVWEER
jgi:CheY-like chemotaxis protein